MKESKPAVAQAILENAAKVVGNRGIDHGNLKDSWTTIAAVWSAFTGVNITPSDALAMMAMMKLVRHKCGNKKNTDHATDSAGYAALMGAIGE